MRMKKYRFILMGQQAVNTLMNEGFDALIEQEVEFELACIENPSDPLEVLSRYNGWFDYANLEPEEFVKLGGKIPEDYTNEDIISDKTIDDFIKELQSISEDKRKLPLVIYAQNGLGVYPKIKMGTKDDKPLIAGGELNRMVITWRD